jgi:predicted O-methyltransferase YrrM
MYGRYAHAISPQSQLYSGLISLPPHLRYMPQLTEILHETPLQDGHDGRRDMCEQGVIAAAFQRLDAFPLPLYQFPFARAFEAAIDYGLEGDLGRAWGYHFGHAFRRANAHFERLCATGEVFSQTDPTPIQRSRWLGNFGQWGVPGWSLPEALSEKILALARPFAGRQTLEIGTSRGRMTSMLAEAGLHVTTLDREDRGAARNLAGLSVIVVQDDLVRYLAQAGRTFDLVVIDLHGNTVADWQRYRPALVAALASGGTMLINNARLAEVDGWPEESGASWFLENLPAGWAGSLVDSVAPGLAVVHRP